MKNNITELVFILDKSGSMSGLEKDTIGGFNSMINKQKKLQGKTYVSTVLFDNNTEVIHDRVSLDGVKPLTDDDYCVGGCTALIDALAGGIKHISNIHKYARKEDVPENTMFVITTDGMENASKKYTAKEVKKMIEKMKKKYNWQFIFLGANIDAVETAKNYGISEEMAVNYNCDSRGTRKIYEGVSRAVSACRCAMPMDSSWREEIDEDYSKRK